MISVLMSVYVKETAANLDAALKSLSNQTLQLVEIVLVKDGVLNKELDEVIQRYANDLPLKVILIEKNVGLANALNYGLTFVTQPWVMRFDSDDYCLPERVKLQTDLINSGQHDLIGGQIAEFEDDMHQVVQSRIVPLTESEISSFCLYRNPFNHMTVCYRKKIVESVGGYPQIPYMEDYALWCLLISKGARTLNSSEILVNARIGNGMIKRRGGLRYIKSEVLLQQYMVKLGLKNMSLAFLHGFMRSSVFLMPSFVRKIMYKFFLRR